MMIGNGGKLLGSALLAVLLLPACAAQDPTPTLQPTPTLAEATPTRTLAEPISPPTPTPTPAEPTATPTPAPPTFEEEWEALKLRAREEGEMALVTGNNSSRGLVPPIREAFGKQFGIEVTIAGGSGGQHMARISAERTAGRYEVDIVIHGRTMMGDRLAPAGFLAPIKDHLFHPDALDPSNWWLDRLWWRQPDGVEPKYSLAFAATGGKNPMNPSYNTDLVTEADIAAINSAWDFLDDKWEGKIIALSPLETGSHGNITNAYSHPELGREWLARFYSRELDVTFVGDVRQIVDSIAGGGHAFSMFERGAQRDILMLADEGLPVAAWTKNLKEGGNVSTASSWNWIGLMDRAPHPNAAKLFLNWWLTEEGQTAYNTLVAGGGQPPSLRDDVPPGVTLPQERRIPGVAYHMSSLDVNLRDRRLEAIEFAQRTFLEGREG